MSSRIAADRLEVCQIYRLLQFVHEDDKFHIEKLVKLGVANLINLTEPQDGIGVLHVATSASSRDMVSFLLSLGAHPDVQDRKGRTPAMLAAQLGTDDILELLTRNKADLALQDAEGQGVLFYCIYPTENHARCLQVALATLTDVNNVSSQGIHIFQLMCEKAQGYTPMCLHMLGEGADPNATNQQTGVTALMEAAKVGSVELVRAILQKGGNPNAVDMKRLTAVHYAAMGAFLEVIQVLSAHAANMCLMDAEDCTPLHYAAATGNANCCKFLAQRGCNPKIKNLKGLLPRIIAKDANHKAAAKELKKAERQQGKACSTGLMSVVWALTLHDWSYEYEQELREAFEGQSDTVSTEMFVSVLEALKAPIELEQLSAIVSVLDEGSRGFISINDFIKGAKHIKKPFLLSAYVPKKKKGPKGPKGKKKKGKFIVPFPICILPPEHMTRRPKGGPPHFMIEKYHKLSDTRRFNPDHPPEHPLIDDSAWYVDSPDKAYADISQCVRNGDLKSLDLAFSQKVRVDIEDPFYKTPLMEACSSGQYEMVRYLLGRGADVNKSDQFFWTPLHHAAHAGHVEIVELLLKVGAPIDAQALNRGTPLMRAIESSRSCCVDFLIKAGADVTAENSKGQNCLDIAAAFGDSRVIELVKEKMDSLPIPKEPEGKGAKRQKAKPSKKK